MELSLQIFNYLNQPGSLWHTGLAQQLADRKLLDMSIIHPDDYTLSSCIANADGIRETNYLLPDTGNIHIVAPSKELNSFYQKHGLVVPPLDQGGSEQVATKVQRALAVFDKVDAVATFIRQIVKSVQILEASDSETDVSYSHPDIPFSIFFSVCQQDSPVGDLRVAESILHEAMHLQLTLIEGCCPLIEQNTKHTYYSPWRDEERPVRGVLHGMFVFRAILDFYLMISQLAVEKDIQAFLQNRISTIITEIKQLSDFGNSPGLTTDGKILTNKLKLSVNGEI
ncbi:MAG: hypothetical protein EOO04_19805 [Chitinophagaceae bacterium]|nr:MAG: hypothetical protein EOO04_19805 [Chitinophagaceae bacterium]